MTTLAASATPRASTGAGRKPAARVSLIALTISFALFAMLSLASRADAAVTFDPAVCTPKVSYDPAIPTPEEVWGTTLAPDTGGTNATNSASKKNSPIIYQYLDAIAAAAPEMVIKKSAGTTALGKDIPYVVVSSPGNITDLEDDAAFWRAVREGEIAPDEAESAVSSRPAFAWISSNVHGDEASSAEATIKLIYELAARRDCANYKRLADLTSFLMPVQNPDGRDDYARTNAWLFDLNRDWHTQEQAENYLKMGDALQYPSVVYVDAHQQGGASFFFPPNEDPVHHELSDASMNGINFIYGPALQKRFNDQNISYNNYSQYDLFTPEYGDTAPSLMLGAAGMTYEKGRAQAYSKQVYDHYLSLDETLNTTSRNKKKILTAWIDQWYEAIAEGAAGELQPNQIVSPGHTISWQVPDQKVFGYYYLPNNHDGDVAKMIGVLQRAGVKAYEIGEDTAVTGMHTFGDMTVANPNGLGPDRQTPTAVSGTLPEGTLYIPMAQSMKHWIQALLGEDPFVPYAYFYDVAGWSFSELKGMSGNGYLMNPLPSGTEMTEIGTPDLGGAPATAQNTYVFSTDSSRALIMAYKLAQAGADVNRSAEPFSAGGVDYPSGSAIVDGATIPVGVNLETMSDEYQTPIGGLASSPLVDMYEIDSPKVAIYAGTAAVTLPPAGRCTGSTTFCQAYFTLSDKMGVPPTVLTSTQINSNELVTGNYTALFNPNTTIAAGATATAVQTFVNGGGNYFAFGSNGLASARNAGMTLVNTASGTAAGPTGGIPVKVDYDTDSPLSWGFDNGGFLFRASGAMTINPTTLTGNGTTIPNAEAAIGYPTPTLRFAYSDPESSNPALNQISRLNGTPAAIDQAFGAGRVTVLTVDPTFRAWMEGAERIILNGFMYPNGPVISPGLRRPAATATDSQPIAVKKLPKVKNRPVKKSHDPNRDLIIRVAKSQGKKLKKAYRQVNVPKKFRKVAKFRKGATTLSLVFPGVRKMDRHPYPWARGLVTKLKSKGVKPKRIQI